MLESIYRLNRWYDRLDNTHPTARFMLFIIPMMVFVVLLNWPHADVLNMLGLAGVMTYATLRTLPIFFPRRR
jgi:hypothetical protein